MPDRSSRSFIPQQSDKDSAMEMPGGMDLGWKLLTAIIIFLALLIVWGGIYGYTYYLETQIEERKATLQSIKDSFQRQDFNEILALSEQLTIAQSLLDRHVAVTEVFGGLEDITVNGVQYRTFSYSGSPSGPIRLVLGGRAHNYSTVISQVAEFTASSIIENVSISGLSELQESDNVSFTMELTVSPDEIRLSDALRPGTGGAAATTTPSNPGAPGQGQPPADFFDGQPRGNSERGASAAGEGAGTTTSSVTPQAKHLTMVTSAAL